MKVVVIGSGIAAEKAISLLAGKEGIDLTVISEEDFSPYARPRLPEYIKGTLARDFFTADSLSKYVEKGLKIVKGRATKIDRENKEVLGDKFSPIPYDKLIIATGSRCNTLNIPLSGVSKVTVRTLQDSDRLIAHRDENIVVIGGGVLGLEIAEALAKRSQKTIKVIERAKYILPVQLDEPSSSYLEQKLKEKNVEVITGVNVLQAENGKLILDNQKSIDAGCIVFSLGVTPNKELAEEAGLEVKRAIVINSKAQTSDEDIYAIGDAAEYETLSPGLVYFALETARVAAKNIIGEEASLTFNTPLTTINIGDVRSYVLGNIRSFSYAERLDDEGVFKSYFFDSDDRLIGVISINDSKDMMKMQKSIGKERKDIEI